MEIRDRGIIKNKIPLHYITRSYQVCSWGTMERVNRKILKSTSKGIDFVDMKLAD